MSAPVVYAKLLEVAQQDAERLIHERLAQSAEDSATSISALLRHVYVQGLRDGFQQGVQTMSESPTPHNGEYVAR